jgi:hypothetical protein
MEALVQSVEALSAELTRQEEERERIARVATEIAASFAAEGEEVHVAIGDEVDANIGVLLEQLQRLPRSVAGERNHRRPTFVGMRA